MKRLTLAIATALALLAALTLAGCGSDDTTTGAGTGSGDHNAADVEFVRAMIPHHEQAVRMAKVAESAAASAEVRDLADRIEAAQGPEIDLMEGWLEDWGLEESDDSDSDHMDGMDGTDDTDDHMDHGSDDMPGMMSDADLADLDRARGAAFDRMFLTMMIEHHEGAVDMARTEQSDGKDRDVVALARTIEAAQTEEIAEMRRLLDS